MSAPFLFVSHVTEDRAAATELVAELERRGVGCWVAPRDVRPGKPYDDEIAGAIDDCAAMLLIFSERCNESHYIRREITVAGEAQKLIIPFRIADAQPKKGLRIRLADLHWIDGFVAREQAIEAIIRSVPPGGAKGTLRVDRAPLESKRATPAPAAGRANHDPASLVGDASARSTRPAVVLSQSASDPSSIASALDHLERLVDLAQVIKGLEGIDGGVGDVSSAAVRWKHNAAEEGNLGAQLLLGRMYFTGAGVERDHRQAAAWYGKVAERGLAGSQFEFGLLHADGLGVAKDDQQAVVWFRKAAEQGYAMAENALGQMYWSGRGVEKDDRAAIAWIRRAADRGLADAQFNLSVAYVFGLGVERDLDKGVAWCTKAAEQNHAVAQFNLGGLFEAGLGVPRDTENAAAWYRKAAEQGHAEARSSLQRL